jgi:hypothetical protein
MPDNDIAEKRAEHGRAIIAQVRELEAEDKARNEAFAATIKSKNKKYIHRRDPAAAMVAAAIGDPYSSERLRRSDCPFVIKGRTAYYAEDDLRQLAEEISDNFIRRHGTPDKRSRKIRTTSHEPR